MHYRWHLRFQEVVELVIGEVLQEWTVHTYG